MKLSSVLMKLLLISLFMLNQACTPAEDDLFSDGEGDAGLVSIAGNLKSIEQNFVPESMTDDGTADAAFFNGLTKTKTYSKTEDICAGLEFMECQPILLRFYVRLGRAAFALSHIIINSVAVGLGELPNGSSGTINIEEEDLTVQFVKNSLLDYELLISSGGSPAGYIKAKDDVYEVQLDINVIEKRNNETRGGVISLTSNFSSVSDWQSELTITDMGCDPDDPKGPESINVEVKRENTVWKGKSMLYSSNALADDSVTCDTPVEPDQGAAIYTDFIADRLAIKSAIYAMSDSQSSTDNLQDFGIDSFCNTFASSCQSIADESGLTLSQVNDIFAEFQNPHCLKRGTRTIEWGEDCTDVSNNVGNTPFRDNSDWMTPADFSQLSLQLPTEL